MRAITIRPPWSWAIAAGHKDVENRTRCIVGGYRGPIAIHAGQQFDHDAIRFIHERLGTDAWLFTDGPTGPLYPAARGAVVAVATLTGAHFPTSACCDSPWALPDQWHLTLADAVQLPEPVPCRGHLGVWALPGSVAAAVHEQLGQMVLTETEVAP